MRANKKTTEDISPSIPVSNRDLTYVLSIESTNTSSLAALRQHITDKHTFSLY